MLKIDSIFLPMEKNMYKLKFNRFLYSKSGVGKLSIKDKIVNSFGFVCLKVSSETTQVCYYDPQAAIYKEQGCVPITILYNRWAHVAFGHSLPKLASGQWLLHLSMHQSHLKGLVKHRFLGLTKRVPV